MLSSEVSPFAKTGGLGDVLGSLPLALRELGFDVRIMMPRYQGIHPDHYSHSPIIPSLPISTGGDSITTQVWEGRLGQTLPVYFIDAPAYFQREGFYGDSQEDYPDNAERFSFFNRAALEITRTLSFIPHIIHCHDWQTALAPVYLKFLYPKDRFFKETRTVFTIHNLGFQGLFEASHFSKLGLPPELFSLEGLEFYGKINLMKGGLLFADHLTTVSQNYCQEIQKKPLGSGLEGVLKKRSNDLVGILNGINTQQWNPETDPNLKERYYPKNLTGKIINKEELQRQHGFPIKKNTPLIGMVTRLTRQKGLDLITDAVDELMKLDLQLIILGAGEKQYQNFLLNLSKRYPQKTQVRIGFQETLARQIYAGCDFFLMPSLYEPCGISQLISLRYGTIPIVRKTGGLADTVKEFNPITGKGHGFLFNHYEKESLLATLNQALDCYKNPQHRKKLILNAMKLDFSWKASALLYRQLYEKF
ncbi:MAG TPA: glycogen synthase GlgA [Nitrospiria bacterium]|jgi:starch synthase